MVILSAIAPAVASSGDANGKICRPSEFCEKTELCTPVFWRNPHLQVIGKIQQEDLLCIMRYAVYVYASKLFNLQARRSGNHPAFPHATRSVTRGDRPPPPPPAKKPGAPKIPVGKAQKRAAKPKPRKRRKANPRRQRPGQGV